jgi:hypothetical protein
MNHTTFIMSLIAALVSLSPVALAGQVQTSNKANIHCAKNNPDHTFVKAVASSSTAQPGKSRKGN